MRQSQKTEPRKRNPENRKQKPPAKDEKPGQCDAIAILSPPTNRLGAWLDSAEGFKVRSYEK